MTTTEYSTLVEKQRLEKLVEKTERIVDDFIKMAVIFINHQDKIDNRDFDRLRTVIKDELYEMNRIEDSGNYWVRSGTLDKQHSILEIP